MSEESIIKVARPKDFYGISNLGSKYLPILEKLIDSKKYFEKLKKNYKKDGFKIQFEYTDYKVSSHINDLHPHKSCGEVRFFITDDEGNEYSNIAGFKFSETTNCCGSLSIQEKYSNLTGCGIGQMLEYLKEDLCRHTSSWSNYCTVPSTMPANIKLLEKNGWNKVDEFKNFNSQNTVYLFNKKFDRAVPLSKELVFRNPFKYMSIYANKV